LRNVSNNIFILKTTFESKSPAETKVAQVRNVLKKIKYIERFVEQKYVIRVVTSHVYGTLCYAAPVWLTEQTRNEHWRLLSSEDWNWRLHE